jgi:hypothetical protein
MDSASLIVSFKDGMSRSGKTVRLGNQIILPPGAGIERHDLSQNIQGITSLYSMLTQVNQSSIGIKRPGLSVIAHDDKSSRTARGESISAANEVQLEKIDVSLYYCYIDMLYQKMVGRVFKQHDSVSKAFIDRCVERGVPKELLEIDRWEISAPRAVGGGSAVMKSLTTQELLSIAAFIPTELGKRNLIKDYVEARGGPESVQRYFPPFEDERMPTKAKQIAQLENNDLEQNQKCIVSVDDYHPNHLSVHLQYFTGYFQQVLQTQEPESIIKAMQIMEGISTHIQQHLAYLSTSDIHKGEFNKAKDEFKQLTEIMTQIQVFGREIIQKRQQEQAKQQKAMQEQMRKGQDAEIEKERYKIDVDAQLRALKEQSNDEIRRIKAAHGMQIDEMLAQHKMQMKELESGLNQGER